MYIIYKFFKDILIYKTPLNCFRVAQARRTH